MPSSTHKVSYIASKRQPAANFQRKAHRVQDVHNTVAGLDFGADHVGGLAHLRHNCQLAAGVRCL